MMKFRDLAPQEATDFERWVWMTVKYPSEREALWEWLRGCLRCGQESAPVLHLVGPPGCGKTMLCRGVSRLWSTEIADIHDVSSGKLLSPFLTCDESVRDAATEVAKRSDVRVAITTNSSQGRAKGAVTVHMTSSVIWKASARRWIEHDQIAKHIIWLGGHAR